jgi:hypothetical protein
VWKACLVAAVLASCFIKPAPPGVGVDGSPGDSDGASNDGTVAGDASTQSNCTNPSIIDFTTMTLMNSCGSWANKIGAGQVNANMSALMLVSGSMSLAGCESKSLSTGAYIKVMGVPTPSDAAMFLEAKTLASQVVGIRLMGQSLMMDSSPPVTFDLNQMRYWRLRRDGPNDLVGEVSSNAMDWMKLGSVQTIATAMDKVTMSFGIGTPTNGGSGAVAEYAACP